MPNLLFLHVQFQMKMTIIKFKVYYWHLAPPPPIATFLWPSLTTMYMSLLRHSTELFLSLENQFLEWFCHQLLPRSPYLMMMVSTVIACIMCQCSLVSHWMFNSVFIRIKIWIWTSCLQCGWGIWICYPWHCFLWWCWRVCATCDHIHCWWNCNW